MKQNPPQKIAIYGGSFDPVHLGHLILAQTALEDLGLDRVILVPSGGQAYYKTESNHASGPDRVEMIRLATGGSPQIEVSSFEVDQGRFCYTIETLRHYRDLLPPGSEITLLVGGDWKDRILTWKEGETILHEFQVAVFSRPGFEHETQMQPDEGENMIYLHMPLIDISSTDIRTRIRAGRSIQYRVPEAVENYIEKKELYREMSLMQSE